MGLIRNVHERRLNAEPATVEALLARLASPDDRLWPAHRWWPQRFDGGLTVGAKGGHGPVRYKVESVGPHRVVFRFPVQGGFLGTHRLEVFPDGDGSILRHTLELRTVGRARLLWPLIRPLHDALLEDCMDNAVRATGGTVAAPARHSAYVRFARRKLGIENRAPTSN
jgi:hypothetical protein